MSHNVVGEQAPLHGLRVLELASGIAGPYAGRLLCMAGATVIKTEPPGGDPARTYPVDDACRSTLSPLYIHLNAGKRNLGHDAAPVDELLSWAQIVIDDHTRAAASGSALELDRLAARDLVLVTVTPWGYEFEQGRGIDDELLVHADAGVPFAASEAFAPPRRLAGWQAQYLAGAYAASGALALLGQRPGFKHVDVPWVTALLTGIEAAVAVDLHKEGRSGGRTARVRPPPFPAGVFRCADGYVVPATLRESDWQAQCAVYDRPELLQDPRFQSDGRFEHRKALCEILQPWYDAHTRAEIFSKSLRAGWPIGTVLTARDALQDAHMRAREFFGELTAARPLRGPVRPFRCTGLPVPDHTVRDAGEDDAWPAPSASAPPCPPPPALAQLRVVELTRAWAGPFVGRWLGAFGADVLKVEAGRSPDIWRSLRRVPTTRGVEADDGHGEWTWDADPFFNMINRNKRSVSVDATHPQGREVLLRLIARADVLVVNLAPHVLERWRIDRALLEQLNPTLVCVQLPALGATGPHRTCSGFGTMIEAMGGLAARFGDPAGPPAVTSTYYPDAVAGVHAVFAVLAALAQRARSGRGCFVDMSQQEVMWLQCGEGLLLAADEQRELVRMGDAEPGRSPSGFFPCANRSWLALVIDSDEAFERLVELACGDLDAFAGLHGAQRVAERARLHEAVARWTQTLPAAELCKRLQQQGLRARVVQTFRQADQRPVTARLDFVERLQHPITQSRRYARIPLFVDGRALESRRHAPLFDQHTDEALQHWLCLDESEITRLRATKAVGTLPSTKNK